ncbi:hypothetical protein VTI28DRAFT_10373 [Corynascus sepedonium]
MNKSPHPTARPPGREHIPIFPKKFATIRIFQLILAFLVVVASAIGVHYRPFFGNAFILIVGLITLCTSTYLLIAEYGPPTAYNYWAILSLDVLLVILWLCCVPMTSGRLRLLFEIADYDRENFGAVTSLYAAFLASQTLATLFGGFEFVLYLISLSIHSVCVHRHRAAGLRSTPVKNTGPFVAPFGVYGPPNPGDPVPMWYQQQHYPSPGGVPPAQQQQSYLQQPMPAYQQNQQQPPQFDPYPYPHAPPREGYTEVPAQPQPQMLAPTPTQTPTPNLTTPTMSTTTPLWTSPAVTTAHEMPTQQYQHVGFYVPPQEMPHQESQQQQQQQQQQTPQQQPQSGGVFLSQGPAQAQVQEEKQQVQQEQGQWQGQGKGQESQIPQSSKKEE